MSVIDPKDIILEKKEVMVLCPSSKMFLPAFQEYTKNLKGKIGVFVNSQYLIYVMAKCPESDEIQTIT